jgi:cell wall-associated NlpC family hydrolase
MSYYFESKEKQDRLREILESWLGTPHRHHVGVKRLGTDCIHFVCRVFEEMGLIKWRKNFMPDYPADWHIHNTRELLREGLEREFKGELFKRDEQKIWIDFDGPMNGDIILCHFGKAASHSGIYMDGLIYQALDQIGVRKISFNDPYMQKHMKFIFRILS